MPYVLLPLLPEHILKFRSFKLNAVLNSDGDRKTRLSGRVTYDEFVSVCGSAFSFPKALCEPRKLYLHVKLRNVMFCLRNNWSDS